MHVAYLLSDLGGGTGQHLLGLLEQRPARAWSAEILSEVESTVAAEFPVPHRVLARPRRFARYPFLQLRRYLEIERYIARRSPDVLHAYFFWSIIYGRVLKARGKISVLVENREDLGFNWGGHEYAMLRLTRGLPDRVVCVCDAVRRTVMEREGIQADRLEVIHNGIRPRPPRTFTLAQAKMALGLPPDQPVVGMVANFDRPVKGATYFVRAIPRILASVPDARFFLIGEGRRESELRVEATRLGIDEERLEFTGFVGDVDRYYAAMDLSVLTSLAEGLSLTLLESMSWGIPVVATRVGGNPELVADGETGVLVPPRDIDAFADAVTRLLRDDERRARFGRAARRRTEEQFALDRTVQRYADLYSRVTK